MRKQVLKSYLKKCEHVTYVTVTTIGIITISTTTNQNCVNKYLSCYAILFLNFLKHNILINWITWCRQHGTIYKNISKLKIKEQKM